MQIDLYRSVLGVLPTAGLDGLVVTGFKSLRDRTAMEIRPLTVFAGRNSSGKSSALQAMLLLKQTLDAPYDPGHILLNGDNVRFSEIEQLFWCGKKKVDRKSEFGVGLTVGKVAVGVHFRREQDSVILDRTTIILSDPPREIELREGMSHDQIASFLALKNPLPDSLRLSVRRSRCVFDIAFEFSTGTEAPFASSIGVPSGILAAVLSRLLHLPGLRGNPQRDYPATQVGPNYPGTFPPYTASVVREWKTTGDERLTKLGDWLRDLGLTWKVDPKPVDATRVDLHVGRLPMPARGGAEDLVSIADVGFGVSQVLPVLVALLAAQEGQVVCVEQPEIHLHPEAQVKLAECLLDAARRKVVVIAETHSHLLLKALQTAVADGRADPKLIKLHWFSRSDDGATRVDSADLDESGAFGDWPGDFSEVELGIEDEFIRAATKHINQ